MQQRSVFRAYQILQQWLTNGHINSRGHRVRPRRSVSARDRSVPAAVSFLEVRQLLSSHSLCVSANVGTDTHDEHSAGVDVAYGYYSPEEYAALEAYVPNSSLSTKTPPANQGQGVTDGTHESNILTFVLDFKESSQGNTTDIFGNVVSALNVTSFGFTPADFNTITNEVLAEINEDYYDELLGTVGRTPTEDLRVDFIIGDIGTAPVGVSEYYYVQIGTGVSGPHTGGGILGVAGGSVVRNAGGNGPNGVQVGDVVSSVFTEIIQGLGGLSPSNALTSGDLQFTRYAIAGTLAHEIGHTLSLSHIDKAGSVQPINAPPIMGTGAIDLPNQDRIGDRAFSISGVDSQNGGAPRQHIQQLVNAVGLHNTGPQNLPPTALQLTNRVSSLSQSTSTASRIKIADIVVTDDGLGTNTLGLSGADAASFEILGNELFLRAGTVLNGVTKPQYLVTVNVDDVAVGTTPDAFASHTLNITLVNNPPTLSLSNLVTTLPEDANTSSRVRVADINITDDGIGVNTLSLTGTDAALFEVQGNQLFIRAGSVLDFETNSILDVTVNVDDASVGSTPDASAPFSLSVTNVNEPPRLSLINTVTSLPETTSTAQRVRVADVEILDDALGTNLLTLGGVDAADFELILGQLYVRSGTVLDFETKPQYSVTISVDDSAVGTTPDDTVTFTLAITDVNEPPVITGFDGAVTYIEDTLPVIIEPSVSVSDIDSTNFENGVLTVAVTNNVTPEDLLGIRHQGPGAGLIGIYEDRVTYSGVALGIFTGGSGATSLTVTLGPTATPDAVQALIQNLTFSNVANAPSTSPRTVAITLSDGDGATSQARTKTVNVVPANDAPVLSGVPITPLNFVEGSAAQSVMPTLVVTDDDSPTLSSARVRITSNYQRFGDALTFTDTPNITATWDSVNGALNLVGVDSVANYQAALRSVRFVNLSKAPTTGVRTIRFLVNDGVINSNVVSRNVTITPVNTGPILTGIETAPLSFHEQAAATPVSTTITVTDPDSSTIAGARITISTNYQTGYEFLSFTNIGPISGTWNPATATMTLTGVDTLANYTAALRTVKFRNITDQPSVLPRTVSFVANDGTSDGAAVTRQINVLPVNDPPVLSAIETSPLPYTEGATIVVTSSVVVTEYDGGNLSSARIRITGNYRVGEDQLLFTNTPSITSAWDAATGVLELSGADTAANYQAALRTVRYQNISEHPSPLLRTVSLLVNDGLVNSNVVARSITITPVNDGPVLAGIETTRATYTNGGPPVVLTSLLTITDADSTMMAGARLRITAGFQLGADLLSFTNTPTITSSWDATTGTLILTGSDTIANYVAALRSIRFSNTSATPTTTTRTVSMLVNDGVVNSNIVTRSILVTL